MMRTRISVVCFAAVSLVASYAQGQESCSTSYLTPDDIYLDFSGEECSDVCYVDWGSGEPIIRCEGGALEDHFVAVSNPTTEEVFIWGWIGTGTNFKPFCCETGDGDITHVEPIAIWGGPGRDTILLRDHPSPYPWHTYHQRSWLAGSGDADLIHGSLDPDFHDEIEGGDGDDVLYAHDGRDYVWGGEGDDQIWGGGSPDYLYGGPGDDEVWGGWGLDCLFGEEGNDWLIGELGYRNGMHGGAGEDYLWADDSHHNVMCGGPGLDTIDAYQGWDHVCAEVGDDCDECDECTWVSPITCEKALEALGCHIYKPSGVWVD